MVPTSIPWKVLATMSKRVFSVQCRGIIAAIVGAALIAGCEGANITNDTPPTKKEHVLGQDGKAGSMFGPSGIFGGGTPNEESGNGIGVNSFLWRASLDTMAFMPLASADPFGGVIITDWYSPPETPDERFKMTVYILDRRLRADGLKVAVFRQQRATDNDWKDQAVSPDTAIELENAILTRARQLRIATLSK